MREAIVVLAIAIVAGCTPESGDDGDPPGKLEYEDPYTQYYRLDRRVDMVGVDPAVDRSGCGFLTDRAYDDLVGTLETLDPNAEYGWSECESNPNGLLYLEGFTNSPFPCSWYCAHPDLLPIAVVYFAVGGNLYDEGPSINGEIYVALEPDMPCPD